MKKFIGLKLLTALGLIALASCRKDELGTTGVQVDLLTMDARLLADNFTLLWLDETQRLFEVRVPEYGTIDEVQAQVVSVFVALDAERVGRRRLFARGYRDGVPVSEATARIDTTANVWLQLGVKMGPAGSLSDTDGDGIPEGIDNCPHEPDPCTGAPPPLDVDAGAPADAGLEPDAAVVTDVAPEASPPDTARAPDATKDAFVVTPQGFDTAPDTVPVDGKMDVALRPQ